MNIGTYAFAGSSRLTIYCEASEASETPSGWTPEWNFSNRPVYWYRENKPSSGGNYWHYYGRAQKGFKISCDDENMIDSKYFAVTKNGEVTASKGDVGGWEIGETGIINQVKDQGTVILEYGLNSNPNLMGQSLYEKDSDNNPVLRKVIFYCKKKLAEGDSSDLYINTEDGYGYTFQLLEDGSLYSTVANFSTGKVTIGGKVKLGQTSVEDIIDLNGGSTQQASTFGLTRNSPEEEEEEDNTFKLLEDGSLYSTTASFNSSNVNFGNNVIIGTMTVDNFVNTITNRTKNYIDLGIYPAPSDGGTRTLTIQVGSEGRSVSVYPYNNGVGAAWKYADDITYLPTATNHHITGNGDFDTSSGIATNVFLYNYVVLGILITAEVLGGMNLPSSVNFTQIDLFPVSENFPEKVLGDMDVHGANIESGGDHTFEGDGLGGGSGLTDDSPPRIAVVFNSEFQWQQGSDLGFALFFKSGEWSTNTSIYPKLRLYFDPPEELPFEDN
jgi:hypothetical protein